MATLTEEEWRELGRRKAKVLVQNKFGGYFIGTVGTIQTSKKWKRKKVFLYDLIFCTTYIPSTRRTAFRRTKLSFRKAVAPQNNIGMRSFFIEDLTLVKESEFMHGGSFVP
jgi:hypothetical protein